MKIFKRIYKLALKVVKYVTLYEMIRDQLKEGKKK